MTRDDVRLIGAPGPGGAPVIEALAHEDEGVAVAKPGGNGANCLADPALRVAGVGVAGLIGEGFAKQGIALVCVDHFEVAGNTTATRAWASASRASAGPSSCRPTCARASISSPTPTVTASWTT